MVEGTYIFDCEVFAHDWLFVFKEVATGEYTVIWNDNDEVLAFMERNPYLGGFNNKHYDNHILKAVMCGFTPEQVKEINDLIIVHELNGWDIPALREYRVYFDSFDLKDDCQDGVSLKGIEAHLGIPIEETEVDFNVDHVLSESEKAQTTYYCKYDVDATEILFKLRQGYLDNKAAVGRKRGLTDRQAMLKNSKIHPRLAFEHCGLFVDSDLAYTLSAEYAEEQEKKAQELLEKQNTEKEDETDDSNTDKGNGAAGGNAAQARQQSGSAD